jgi:hypothetical protein
MFRFASPLTLRLARDELLVWKQGAVQVRVVSGGIWITQRSDLDDHFLFAGQVLDLRPGAGALIGAEQDSHLRFETRARPLGLLRWMGLLTRRLQWWGEQNKISLHLQ